MKKQTKLLLFLTALMVMALAFSAFAYAADESDKAMITAENIKFGDKDVSKIDVTGSHKLKEIGFEAEALKLIDASGKTINIDMGDFTMSLPASALFTSDWTTALASGEPVEVYLDITVDAYIDTAQHFNDYKQSLKGNYLFNTYGVDIDASIYVAGKKTYTLTKFAKPVTITYDYDGDWQAKTGLTEKNITMAWYDLDKQISDTQEWSRQATKVNTKDKLATGTTSYACGYLLFIACKDVDNSGGGSGSVNIETGAGTGSVSVVTGGIPAGHWATADIEAMQQAGIVPNDLSKVNVNDPITRGEFAAYVVKTLGLAEDTSLAGKFIDVKSDNPYYKEILTGTANGIISGVSDTMFQPNAKITRQEMAALFARALNKKSVEVSKDTTKLGAMKDAGSISSWAKESCAIAVNTGLIGGKTGNLFGPKDNTTWAEAVVMLNRLYAKLK